MTQPERRIRVLLALPIGHLGGGPETVRLLAKHLDREQFETCVVCPDSPIMEKIGQITDVKRVFFSFPRVPTPSALRAFASILQRERPDVLHTQLFHGDLYGFLATRFTPVPVLAATLQGINFHWEMERFPRRASWWVASKLYRAMYRGFDGVVACSAAVKEAACRRPGIRLNQKQVGVIHNTMDIQEILERSGPKEASRPDPVAKRPFRIITVANFDPVKGHAVLLEALRPLVPQFPLECLLVGDGPTRSVMEAKAEELGLASIVQFFGYRNDVPALLKECDLFVLPSLWDGLGIAVLEAMVLGVPVVASATGGVPEIVRDGETGILVPPGDAGALAEGIRRLLSDLPLRNRLALRAKQEVERFDARWMASAYGRWYLQMLVRKDLRKEAEPIPSSHETALCGAPSS